MSKRLFTVAFAAGAALLAWTIQNRDAETWLILAGRYGVIVAFVGAACMLAWAVVALRNLKGGTG